MHQFYLIILLVVALKSSIADIQDDLQNQFNNFTANLPHNVSSKIPSQEDAERLLEEKCKKQGGDEAFERAKAANAQVGNCIKDLVDFEALNEEMEKAKPSGDLDTVFKKYCEKSPKMKNCITDYTNDLEACLDDKEKNSKDIILNVTDNLVNFICFKEGDRIALFIAEGGPVCLNQSSDAIKGCLQSIYGDKLKTDSPQLQDLPSLLFQDEDCQAFFDLQRCVVKELEKCSEPTPANIVDSLFTYVKRVTPCSAVDDKHKPKEAAAGMGVKLSNSIGVLGATLLMYVLSRLI